MDRFRTPRCGRAVGLVAPVRRDPTGVDGPTRSAARHGRWRRTASGWYVPAGTPRSPQQRVVEASVHTGLVGAVSGWASLHWQGAGYLDGSRHGDELPVLLLLGHLGNPRPQPGCLVSREALHLRDVIVVDGVRCTTPARAVFDEVRRAPDWRAGVVVADMAVAAGLVTPEQLVDDVTTRNGLTHVSRARTVYGLVRAGHRSPQEALLGLAWEVDAGLPPPLYNRPVFDRDGTLLGVPDLFDPGAALAVEYDGVDHAVGDRRRSDVARRDAFGDRGIECLTVVRGELADLPAVVRRLTGARRRARFPTDDQRRWTLVAPPWWAPFAAARGLAA